MSAFKDEKSIRSPDAFRASFRAAAARRGWRGGGRGGGGCRGGHRGSRPASRTGMSGHHLARSAVRLLRFGDEAALDTSPGVRKVLQFEVESTMLPSGNTKPTDARDLAASCRPSKSGTVTNL